MNPSGFDGVDMINPLWLDQIAQAGEIRLALSVLSTAGPGRNQPRPYCGTELHQIFGVPSANVMRHKRCNKIHSTNHRVRAARILARLKGKS
jgi:hypothetical protein